MDVMIIAQGLVQPKTVKIANIFTFIFFHNVTLISNRYVHIHYFYIYDIESLLETET